MHVLNLTSLLFALFFVSHVFAEKDLSDGANLDTDVNVVEDPYSDLPRLHIRLLQQLKNVPRTEKSKRVIAQTQDILLRTIQRFGVNDLNTSQSIDDILAQLGEQTINDTANNVAATVNAAESEQSMTTADAEKNQTASTTSDDGTEKKNDGDVQLSTSNGDTNIENASKDVVVIGKTAYEKARFTDVGDIDGNGFSDCVIASPNINENTGSIRLYLMKDNTTFLFSRELVPGKWGFGGNALKPGDRFGASVFKLPRGRLEFPPTIAIGAPGDTSGAGCVYFVQLTKSGSVSTVSKFGASTDQSLARQHDENEGFGTDIMAMGDLNGDGDFELVVKALSGSSTVLFTNPVGKIKVGLKFHNQKKGKVLASSGSGPFDKNEVQQGMSLIKSKFLSVRPAVSSECIYNETNCACMLKSPEPGSASCVDYAGIEEGTGKSLCTKRDCSASYQCSCDGTEFCTRTSLMKDLYVVDGVASNGMVYCSKASSEVAVNVVQEGVAVPSSIGVSDFQTFNSTHCTCSPKNELYGPSECLDFHQSITDVSILCKVRDCNQGDGDYTCDGAGTSYCQRKFVQGLYYVNDGPTNVDGIAFCHQDNHVVERLEKIF